MRCRRFDHNLLLLGARGAGQSRLVRQLTILLPKMTLVEALKTPASITSSALPASPATAPRSSRDEAGGNE
jgi:predicted ATPase with chaperone activity